MIRLLSGRKIDEIASNLDLKTSIYIFQAQFSMIRRWSADKRTRLARRRDERKGEVKEGIEGVKSTC